MPDHPVRNLTDLLPRLERLMDRIESLLSAYAGGPGDESGDALADLSHSMGK